MDNRQHVADFLCTGFGNMPARAKDRVVEEEDARVGADGFHEVTMSAGNLVPATGVGVDDRKNVVHLCPLRPNKRSKRRASARRPTVPTRRTASFKRMF